MRALLGALLSLFLHAGVVFSALVYFPAASRLAADSVVIPIELVTISDVTNVRAARREPEPEIEEPLPEEEPPAPEPEPIEPEPEAAPEIIPPAPQEEPEPEPEPVVPDPEPDPVEPEPEPEPEQPRNTAPSFDDLGDLANEVSRLQNRADADQGDNRAAVGNGTDNTATIQAAFQAQINRCVRANLDAPSNMDLRVSVEVRLDRDGSLSQPPRLLNEARIRNSSNPFLRVAGDRALRAVITCAPYQLPPQNYQEWRLLQVNVDTQGNR